jgi:endonuclease/exonuclease/phosphatase family metal-dependent hydrolase
MSNENTILVGSWNVESGGNPKYFKTNELPQTPTHYPEILQGVEALKQHGVEAISLIDTHGWPKQATKEKLEKDTEFSFAITAPLEDKRMAEEGIDTSVTFLTNLPVESFETVRLHNRNGLRVTVVKEGVKTDIYSVYLDDASEKRRILQTDALVKQIKDRHNPTIVMGDFNCTSRKDITAKSQLIQTMFETLPKDILRYRYVSPAHTILSRMHELTEKYKNHGPILYLTSEGFTDSSTMDHRETYPSKKLFPFPFIDVDHILVSPGIKFIDTVVLTDHKFLASDHYPRIANLKI